MYFINSYFTVAIFLAVIAGVAISVLHWRNLNAAESRLKRMMVCCGIDEETVANVDQIRTIDMDAVRSRCRNCPVTDKCDRWLDGESFASNGFCPNAWHFTKMAGPSRARDSMSSWLAG